MTLLVERKSLNEKEYYSMEIDNNETSEVVNPDDDTVIELFYEMLKDKDLS